MRERKAVLLDYSNLNFSYQRCNLATLARDSVHSPLSAAAAWQQRCATQSVAGTKLSIKASIILMLNGTKQQQLQACMYMSMYKYVCLSHSRYCVQVCARKTKRNERKHFYISPVHSAKIFTMRRRAAAASVAGAAAASAAAALLEQGMHAERGGVLRGII